MERVADSQARSESLRSTIIYSQDLRTRFLKGRGKVSREEEHRFTVAPTPDGFTKTRTYLRGALRHKEALMPYSEPHFYRGMVDIDAVLSEALIDMVDNDSRDGMSSQLFPLTSNQQRKYVFRLLGTETLDGLEVFRVAFEPRKKGVPRKERGHWKGEVFVDRTQFQPVYVTTSFATKIPLPIRVGLGTNVRQVGFALRYEEVDDGLWFPVSYGGEFRIRALFLYSRTATISLINSAFQRTDVDSHVTFDETDATVQ